MAATRPVTQPVSVRLPLELRDQLDRACARAGSWSRSDVHRAALRLGVAAIAAATKPTLAVLMLMHGWDEADDATAAAAAALWPRATPRPRKPS